jgi:hypothetical protein
MKEVEPLQWRLEGTSGDGARVTLGKYHTREQAETDRDKFTQAGYYRELRIIAIAPVKAAPP